MDPATIFCPNLACPARGHVGQGNIGIHSRQGPALHLYAVPQDLRGDKRDGVLPPADASRNRDARAHAPRPRLSPASHRRGFWV